MELINKYEAERKVMNRYHQSGSAAPPQTEPWVFYNKMTFLDSRKDDSKLIFETLKESGTSIPKIDEFAKKKMEKNKEVDKKMNTLEKLTERAFGFLEDLSSKDNNSSNSQNMCPELIPVNEYFIKLSDDSKIKCLGDFLQVLQKYKVNKTDT